MKKSIEMECFEATKFLELASQSTDIILNHEQLSFIKMSEKVSRYMVVCMPDHNWKIMNANVVVRSPVSDEEPRNIVFILKEYAQNDLPITPHKQKFLHDPENGVNGDCVRAVVASMLNKEDIEDVPHFGEGLDFSPEARAESGPLFEKRVADYLDTQGIKQFKIAYTCGLEELMGYLRGNEGVPIIIDGMSPRGRNHSVIYMNGEMIHDPHPDNTGIYGQMDNGQIHATVFVKVPLGEQRFKG